ncbi:MAG: cytochrome P460 family protein [Pyrinomonadaceae bacterium]
MKRNTLLLVVVAALACVAAFTATTSRHAAAQEAAPIFVKTIPAGYRDWKVVSVAHEAGDINDIRAVLGNDIAIKAYRDGKFPFPEGAIVGRIAWSHTSSEENNKTFGQDQSFVAGSPTNTYLQFMVKDSKKYAATGGWGYSSFESRWQTYGRGGDEEMLSLSSGYRCSRLRVQQICTVIRVK